MICKIAGCTRTAKARGYCNPHLYRWNTYGDPLAAGIRAPRGTGTITPVGYHIHCLNGKDTPEHVLIAEKVLGRKLRPPEEVHHVNEQRGDNRNENLVVCPDRAYHMLLHQRMRAFAACGHAGWRKCTYCKVYDDPANLHIGSSTPRHTACHTTNERNREKP